MPPAESVPRLPTDGAPLSVLLDFDGTISRVDVGDELMARHAPDLELVREKDRLYDLGAIGSRALMAWDMEVLPRDPELLRREAAAMPLDETVVPLVETVRAAGAVVEVVSDGMGFYVEGLLAGLGLDLPVATNATVPGLGGAGMSFPYGHPTCLVCGTCKRQRVLLHRAAGRAVVLVGDGASDRYAAAHADVVFAKGSLARHCARLGREHLAWERLSDVTAWIVAALGDGRLPREAGELAAWSARWRTADRWICGPEAWGEGRTTPPAPASGG